MHYPTWILSTYWLVAFLTSLLFFGSILAHELGHSLVALHFGIPVKSITLFIFGGVAQITQEPKRPQEELYIALGGPAVSVVLAGLFYGFARVINLPGSPIEAVGFWLALINLSLTIFNLIPGFPLDGGRVFRAIVWALTSNYQKATRIASGLGQFIAYGLIAIGIWLAISVTLWEGLWVGFIGWFLLNASISSWKEVSFQERLRDLTANDILMTDCPRVSPTLSLESLVNEYVLHTARRCFPVLENHQTLGIVTLNEIKVIPKERWNSTMVGEVMVPFDKTVKVSPFTRLSEVFEHMTKYQVNQMPVVAESQFLGMVSREEILNVLSNRSELGI